MGVYTATANKFRCQPGEGNSNHLSGRVVAYGVHSIYLLVVVFLTGYFIFLSEYTLKLNNIQGVSRIDSAGQLMPLMVAVGGAVGTFYQMLFGDRQTKYREVIAEVITKR